MADKYTVSLYKSLQNAIDYAEEYFFTSKGKKAFPKIVLSLDSSCRRSCVASVVVKYLYDKKIKEILQFMTFNPDYFDRTTEKILSTVVHELCHIYEIAYIHTPRSGYHSKKWEALMLECGLSPIFNNKSRTSVTQKIEEDSVFKEFAASFEESNPDWLTCVRYSPNKTGNEDGDNSDDFPELPKQPNRNKIKYTCPECDAHVWGKPNLNIRCGDCECLFEEDV